MQIGDKVKVLGLIPCMSGYPCHIKLIYDGDYYICSEFECRWLEDTEFEVDIEPILPQLKELLK